MPFDQFPIRMFESVKTSSIMEQAGFIREYRLVKGARLVWWTQ